MGNEVYVLYYGDYDPTGRRMVEKLRGELEKLGAGVHFTHVAINKQQIKQFRLEHLKNTDPTVMEKLRRDPNARRFMEENNGELFQIEVDSLDALDPDALKDLLLKNIDAHFNQLLYDRVLADPNHQPRNIRSLVLKKLRDRIG